MIDPEITKMPTFDNLILVLILLTSGFNATMRVIDKLIEKRKNGRNEANRATQIQKVEVGKSSQMVEKPGFASTCINHTTSIAVLQNICADIKGDISKINDNVGKIFDRLGKR